MLNQPLTAAAHGWSRWHPLRAGWSRWALRGGRRDGGQERGLFEVDRDFALEAGFDAGIWCQTPLSYSKSATYSWRCRVAVPERACDHRAEPARGWSRPVGTDQVPVFQLETLQLGLRRRIRRPPGALRLGPRGARPIASYRPKPARGASANRSSGRLPSSPRLPRSPSARAADDRDLDDRDLTPLHASGLQHRDGSRRWYRWAPRRGIATKR